MADFPGLPAFAGPVVDSTPIPMGDGVFSRDGTAEQLAAYMATKNGNVRPLARWNETDTTQFDEDQTPPTPAINVGVTGPVFNVAGGVLNIGASSITANGLAVYWLDGTYDLEDIETIGMFVGMSLPTLGDELRVGLAFAGDKDLETFFLFTSGYDATQAPAYALSRADAPGGALIAAGAKGGVGQLLLHMNGSVPGGTYPSALFRWEFIMHAEADPRADGLLSTGYINAIAPFSSTWNTAACNKIGVAIQTGASGMANPLNAFVTDFFVKRRND